MCVIFTKICLKFYFLIKILSSVMICCRRESIVTRSELSLSSDGRRRHCGVIRDPLGYVRSQRCRGSCAPSASGLRHPAALTPRPPWTHVRINSLFFSTVGCSICTIVGNLLATEEHLHSPYRRSVDVLFVNLRCCVTVQKLLVRSPLPHPPPTARAARGSQRSALKSEIATLTLTTLQNRLQ